MVGYLDVSACWLINDEAFKDFKLAKKRLTMPNRRRDEKGGMSNLREVGGGGKGGGIWLVVIMQKMLIIIYVMYHSLLYTNTLLTL